MGAAFIIPGISGGAIAVVTGIYERMIKFMANPFKNFWDNFFFFFPVGMGAVFGVFVFALFFNFFYQVAHAQLIWFFIGCILGTLPALWQQAGCKGRSPFYIGVMVTTCVSAFLFLTFVSNAVGGAITLNIYTWVMAGAIISLGSIVPGFSSANILIFLQMYAPMTQGISNINFFVIIPMGVGLVAGTICFSQMIAFALKKAYSLLFHMILGLVVASTVLIVPIDYNYLSLGGLICVVMLILGTILGLWLCRMEKSKNVID